jgi:hypothetical protein
MLFFERARVKEIRKILLWKRSDNGCFAGPAGDFNRKMIGKDT